MANEVRTGVHNALPYLVLDDSHWHIHIGEMNYVSLPMTFSSNLVEQNIYFETAKGKHTHFVPNIDTNGPMTYKLYEDVVCIASSKGTLIDHFNMNRNFTTSGQTTFFQNVSTLALSSSKLIYDGLIVGSTGGGVGVQIAESIGGSSGSMFALKNSSNYLLVMKNTSAVASQAHFTCTFYEE